MAATDRDLLEGEFSDGCRKFDRDGAESDADGAVCLLDVVDGEPGDRGGPLGIGELVTGSDGFRSVGTARAVPLGHLPDPWPGPLAPR
jgi:hypothetical protein